MSFSFRFPLLPLHPNATAQTIINKFRKINGTRIRVRVEFIRFMSFALVEVWSAMEEVPKASGCEEAEVPQPTVWVRRW